MIVLSVFWQENGLGPLGVKHESLVSTFDKPKNNTLKIYNLLV